MNPPDSRLNLSGATAILRNFVAVGESQEALIYRMREMGLNQIQCIKALRELPGLPPGESKAAVHCSRAWQDSRESNDALHEAAFGAAEGLGYVEERVG